jgi:hypothetical protein
MRKLCFVLTALLLTAPAFAGVVVSCAQVAGEEQVEVSYTASDDANRPRAFGLDITLDNGAVIGDIVSGSESEDYWVYPGTIVIVNGIITDDGSPAAPNDATGACGGPGESCMTVELGSLYNDPCDPVHQDPPPLTGALFRFTVSGPACTVSISGNSARGNVVLEDTEEADTSYGTCAYAPPECLIGGALYANEHSDWVTWNRPSCWCFQRQCRGDIDDSKQLGVFTVYSEDLAGLRAAYSKTNAQLAAITYTTVASGGKTFPGICADVDHQPQLGVFRVYSLDLAELRSYYSKVDAQVPLCNAAPIKTGPYNFWTTKADY